MGRSHGTPLKHKQYLNKGNSNAQIHNCANMRDAEFECGEWGWQKESEGK